MSAGQRACSIDMPSLLQSLDLRHVLDNCWTIQGKKRVGTMSRPPRKPQEASGAKVDPKAGRGPDRLLTGTRGGRRRSMGLFSPKLSPLACFVCSQMFFCGTNAQKRTFCFVLCSSGVVGLLVLWAPCWPWLCLGVASLSGFPLKLLRSPGSPEGLWLLLC